MGRGFFVVTELLRGVLTLAIGTVTQVIPGEARGVLRQITPALTQRFGQRIKHGIAVVTRPGFGRCFHRLRQATTPLSGRGGQSLQPDRLAVTYCPLQLVVDFAENVLHDLNMLREPLDGRYVFGHQVARERLCRFTRHEKDESWSHATPDRIDGQNVAAQESERLATEATKAQRPATVTLRRAPVLDSQRRHPGEVGRVAGDENPLSFECRGGDDDIGIPMRMTVLSS